MHPVDSLIIGFLLIGFILVFIRVIRQISGLILKCVHHIFILTIIIFILLGLYRLGNYALLRFGVVSIFDVELAKVSEFLYESIVIQYAMNAIDSVVSFSHILMVNDMIFYFKDIIQKSGWL